MTEDDEISQELRRRDIEAVYKVLAEVEVSPWLMNEALLGAVTTEEVLPGDRDIDMALLAIDRQAFDQQIDHFQKIGFDVKERLDPVTEKPLNMVVLRRHSKPIEIRFFEVSQGFAYREIHKNLTPDSEIAWDIIDLLHSGKIDRASRFFRTSKFKAKVLMSLRCILPSSLVRSLTQRWCRKWREMQVAYGAEIHPADWFDGIKAARYSGADVLIPERWEDYVKGEYGDHWREPENRGKGGWMKRSHVVAPRSSDDHERLSFADVTRLQAARLLD